MKIQYGNLITKPDVQRAPGIVAENLVRMILLTMVAVISGSTSVSAQEVEPSPATPSRASVPIDPAVQRTVQEQEQTEEQEQQQAEEVAQPVIIYDMVGGFRMQPPEGFVREPILCVYADGRVVAGRSSPQLAASETVISDDELTDLLRFAVEEQKFMELNTDAIKQGIADTGRQIMLADAGTSSLTFNLESGSNTVQAYALGYIARDFQEVEQVVRLAAIEAKLKPLRNRAYLGSYEQAGAILTEINAKLAEEYEGVEPFEMTDLQSAQVRENGMRRVRFSKSALYKSEEPDRFEAIYKQVDENDAEIEIKFYESRRRR